jgi:hypothetical protein
MPGRLLGCFVSMSASIHPAAGVGDAPLRQVWRDPTVRRRIVEYLGGRRLETATCAFLGQLDPGDPSAFQRHAPEALDRMLDEGVEMARSLEDSVSMLIHLDVEYVNFDDPAAAYLDPQRIFQLQEPLVEAIEAGLLAHGIRYLHLVTGQGHHFVWRIPKGSAVAKAIAGLEIRTPCDSCHAPPDPLFPNLALVMEHFAHQVKREAAAASEVPVEITALHVGPGASGCREMLSIDLSEYGDPLHSRMIRIPYTVYRKPWLSGLIGRMGLDGAVSEFCTLPLHEMDLSTLLRRRGRPDRIISLARRAGVVIPVQEEGTQRLLNDYLGSDLCRFHRMFYSVPQDDPAQWAGGYDRTPLGALPPCAVHVLTEPNDWLLKPSGIQLVTRCLLACGWHPRHIAGLIRSKFESPVYHWGERWREYDPSQRAEFYVRLFAGQIACHIDEGVDFNCVSQQEKQFCWNPCGCTLDGHRHALQHLFHPTQPQTQSTP